jgi:hypothetical protein
LSQNLADRLDGLVGFLVKKIVKTPTIGLRQRGSTFGLTDFFLPTSGRIPTGSRCDRKQEGDQIGVLQFEPPKD